MKDFLLTLHCYKRTSFITQNAVLFCDNNRQVENNNLINIPDELLQTIPIITILI